MDPDKFQMRDMKRRLTRLEDQISYLKTDFKRLSQKYNKISNRMDPLWSILEALERQTR